MNTIISFMSYNYEEINKLREQLKKNYDEVEVVKNKGAAGTLWGVMAATPKKK